MSQTNRQTTMECVDDRFVERTDDFITDDFYAIVLTPLVAASVIIVVGVARTAYHPEKRDQISHIHSSLLLLLSFLVLPATSMKVRAVWHDVCCPPS